MRKSRRVMALVLSEKRLNREISCALIKLPVIVCYFLSGNIFLVKCLYKKFNSVVMSVLWAVSKMTVRQFLLFRVKQPIELKCYFHVGIKFVLRNTYKKRLMSGNKIKAIKSIINIKLARSPSPKRVIDSDITNSSLRITCTL